MRTVEERGSRIERGQASSVRDSARAGAVLLRERLATAWRWSAVPLTLATSIRVFLFCFAAVAAQLVLRHPNNALAIWNWWDSTLYIRVARNGYSYSLTTGSVVNFFPLYPLLIRAGEPLARLFDPASAYLLAGVAVSWLTFAAACVLLYHFTLERFGRATATSTVLLLTIFPFSLYFGGAFTESLYLLLAVMAFYAVEHQRWWLAGSACLLVGAERPPGLLVGVCVILAYALDWLRTRHPLRTDVLALALTPLGTLAYFGYLWWRFGTPLAYFHSSEVGWHGGHLQTTGLLLAWNVLRALPHALTSGQYNLVLNSIYVVILVAVVLLSIPVTRRLGLPYGVFTAGSVLLPVATFAGVNSMGRYASVAFPLFILLAVWLRERPVARELVVAGFAVCLGLFTTLFVTGYPLA